MCQQHGQKAFFHMQRHIKQHQSHSGNDFRIHDRKIVDLLYNLPYNTAGLAQPDGGNRSDNRRNKCRHNSGNQRIIDGLHHIAVIEHLVIPLQGEAVKARQGAAAVEGKNQHI